MEMVNTLVIGNSLVILWNKNCLYYTILWKWKCVPATIKKLGRNNCCTSLTKLASLMLMLDVGDGNSQNFHKNLQVFANTFRHQHPSPTSMNPFK